MEISQDDFMLFVDRALDGMLGIVEGLGDDLANRNPGLPGANSPFAILYHSVAVCHYWIGVHLADRDFKRDRPSEFVATGKVTDLRESVLDLKRQLREDIKHVQGDQPPVTGPNQQYFPLGSEYEGWTQGAALIHTLEELAQHRGQMELTRDILLKG
ncbi:MAG TPA: DUF664 domain-containing protein [Dehalococcoidia bacterium]|nr:DUF664 domain-containing protein [Dehalococcoidia bacterium]